MQVPIDTPHRLMYWNIDSPYKFFIYPLMLVATGIFAYGVYKKFTFWKQGQPDPKRFGDWEKRIINFIWEIPFQTRVLKDRNGGLLHVIIFWAFLALTAVTAVVFVDVDFGIPLYNGTFYLLLTLLADLAGLALMVGLGMAAWRRYVTKPDRLDTPKWDDGVVLAVLAAIGLTGFFLEGLRIAYTNDQWAAWSPVGYVISLALGGLDENVARRIYQVGWWIHFAGMFGFMALLPYTKLFHIFTLPANVLFASLEPKGSLPRVDIEAMMNDEAAMENFNVGVSEVKDLTWKMRLDYDACIRCGRCQEVCPSARNNKPLSPKKFIAAMKDFCEQNSDVPAPVVSMGESISTEPAEPKLIVGNAFETDTIWECRTCRACMEVCPAHIDHIPQMMEMRRAEVMMRGQLPSDASVTLKTLERGGNPFGPQEERANWIAENEIPVIGPGEECDALFWIGCCTTYDLLKQKVAYNVLHILMQSGVKVGVLGAEETCCGDPARLLGDENLFQATVKAQIEAIQSRKFKYFISHCPHCYSVFKNEYPQFGAKFKVYHHTEVIAELIKEGKIKLTQPIERKITYHDPCYLGRYNDIYEEPRDVLKGIKGVQLVEMEHHHELSQCCGGGGGHYWMDIPSGERINVTRVKEAQAAEADIMAVSCVYCLQMLNDGIKTLDIEEKMEVFDLSELVVRAMGGIAGTQAVPSAEKKAEAA